MQHHPEAEKLYVEKIDLGEGKPRTARSASDADHGNYPFFWHQLYACGVKAHAHCVARNPLAHENLQ